MNLNKFFSPLEQNDYPDDFFIGEYGFTVGGVEEKLRNVKDEKDAMNYLVRLRDNMIELNQDLKPYSFSAFYDYSKDGFAIELRDNNTFAKNDAYSEAKEKYEIFISNLNLKEITNHLLKIILDDIKFKKRDIDVSSLRSEFRPFIFWIEGIIRKISMIMEVSGVDEIDVEENELGEKIVWMKKKEDFVALFDKLFKAGFFPYKKNKYQVLAKHFSWLGEEIDSNKLRHLKNNIINKPETHQISDELKNLSFK